MDTNTFNNEYEQVDPAKDAEYRKKTRKSLYVIMGSVFVLAVLAVVITSIMVHKNNNNNNNKSSSKTPPSTGTSSAVALKAVCKETLYPDLCYSSISALNLKNTTDPEELFRISLRLAIDSIHSLSTTLAAKKDTTSANKALEVCQVVLDDALDTLNDSLSSTEVLSLPKIHDLKTWLSTTITDQDTCLDALDEVNATALIGDSMTKPTQYASNSLSIVAKILGVLAKFDVPVNRRLLGIGHTGGHGFPEWVSSGDRRLLQQANPRPHVTVAKDGTGDCTTIKEAVKRIPKKSNNRFVIYVKAGKYVENNLLEKSMWNVMIYGDGKDKTIVSGSLNFIDGTPTFHTATFAVAGKGFMAKDMAFKNTAGPQKHQAVAFRSGSDNSVFYRCNFEAFQDTLYAHSNRQFYRECDITGTVDFIFGNAAVVFQKCNIRPRQPMENQYVTITAQGKKDPNQETGISIQKCTISAFDKLKAPVYLGRPWKNFSTTVIMQSNIGAFVKPVGWIEWVSGVEPPKTIMYAEYANTGPGAALGGRVKWAGYKAPFSAKEASKFTVGNFIKGSRWLPATKVPFDWGL
ncbi:Pectinesterase [Heracleum sosnowskyi]|uniref:Pectinesterase n=1 Tax=Heracleum sosnowskyi TaxID=360622 RepID=A0AAD8M427_9APIA|nr:Pectinesterase [Heracleum sosnowskyi]